MSTPTTIVDQVKWQVDRARGGRLVVADMLTTINRLYKEMWEMIINAAPARFVKEGPIVAATLTPFTLTGGASSNSKVIAEPDFYRLYDGERSAVQRLHADAVNWLDVPVHHRESPQLSYRWESDTLYFEPPVDAAGTYKFRFVYTPAATALSAGTTLTDFNGWVEAAMVMMLVMMVRSREEESENIIATHLAQFLAKVQNYATQRQALPRVIDVRSQRRRSNRDDWE